eukprot:bmy_07307T0
MNMLFLNMKVRRTHLVSDSLDELTRKRADLKKKLKVTFVGEAGLGMGGLTKEWFLLLIRQIFHPDYGMFTYYKDSYCHWFSSFKCDNYSEFRLVGILMGLAVYNSIVLDIRFPPCCYKKLLSPPIVPKDQNRPKEYVQLYIDFLLNKSMYKQFAAFYYGFHSVCASNALMLLRPEEVEILVCGSPELDMHALQRSTQYDGYAKTDLTI